MDNFGYVYKIDFFKDKGDILPDKNIICLNAEDTHWVFKSKQWAEELIKVEYAMILTEDPIYLRAKVTSNAIKELNEKSQENPISER